jgi:phosphoglycolate phosphatase
MPKISARVVSGIGKGADFTQLDWVKTAFLNQLGIDAHPGTLNLEVESPASIAAWRELKQTEGLRIDGSPFSACDCRCYPITVGGRFPAAIVYPEVASYPEQRIEVIAALPLREQLQLGDGDSLSFASHEPLNVSAVIFDVDGTLVDTIEVFWRIAQESSGDFRAKMSHEMVCRSLNEGTMFWTDVVPQDYPDREQVIDAMLQEARRIAPGIVAEHGRVLDGVGETLATLKKAGARLAIVTGGESMDLLEQADLLGYFEVVVTNKDIAKRKPAPDGLLRCVKQLGISVENAVYVGDSLIDVQACQAAGMYCIGVLSGAGSSAVLSSAGADRIAHSHATLARMLEIG